MPKYWEAPENAIRRVIPGDDSKMIYFTVPVRTGFERLIAIQSGAGNAMFWIHKNYR